MTKTILVALAMTGVFGCVMWSVARAQGDACAKPREPGDRRACMCDGAGRAPLRDEDGLVSGALAALASGVGARGQPCAPAP